MNQVQHELKHFGVLGMHWGKHKVSREQMAEEIIGRKIKPNDFGGKITKKGALKVKQYDEQKSRYNKVRKAGDPIHGYVNATNSRRGVEKIVKRMEKGQSYSASVKKHAAAKSVVAGLLASNLGALAVLKITGSAGLAQKTAPILGVLAGVKYHQLINKKAKGTL